MEFVCRSRLQNVNKIHKKNERLIFFFHLFICMTDGNPTAGLTQITVKSELFIFEF